MAKMTKQRAKEFYATMYKIRRFEEEVFEFYKLGQMAGLAHLYIGEEAVAAGACAAIDKQDYIGSTHRGPWTSGCPRCRYGQDDGRNPWKSYRLFKR